jgi:hypothetical protein
VRNAAGQLSDRLHFLSLPQCLLGLHALGDFEGNPLLQRLVQALELRCSFFCLATGNEQFAFILAPVRGVEGCNPVDQRLTRRISLLNNVHEHRQLAASGTAQIKGDLVHEALHMQQGRKMGIVEHATGNGQDILEPSSDQFLAAEAEPAQERLVDPDDGAVGQRREVAAGSVLIELLSGLEQRLLVNGHCS